MNFNASEFIGFPPNLSKKNTIEISRDITNRYNLDCSKLQKFSREIAYESDLNYKKNTVSKVIKMAKKEHVDDFFETGKIQLGTFSYYRSLENKQSGDKREGAGLLVCKAANLTFFTVYQEGNHHLVFCTYDGDPDPKIIAEFGYDSGFEIFDIEKFNLAIAKRVEAEESVHSNCLYRNMKVVVSDLHINKRINSISRELIDMIGPTKYFVKTVDYHHQKEYRFIWKVKNIKDDKMIIECPEAIDYCRPL